MASFFQKRRARRRLGRSVSIWYHVEYKARSLAGTARVAKIVVDRGERILGKLWQERLLRTTDVHPSPMASLRDLSSVHPVDYLKSVLDAQRLGRIFGLEARDVDVDEVLTAQRYAVGGTIDAATWASERASRVAFNLGGGFHHAEPEVGSGFCVYNDIAIAIARLREQGYDKPIAIVDLDFHQGNGNIVAFSKDESVLTYSIQGSTWGHHEAATDHQILLPSGTGDGDYMEALREGLADHLRVHGAELVFYIAGTDVLKGDNLGTFSLSPQGILDRDRFVIETARSLDASVVVTLGGGYSEIAWQTTTNLIRWVLTDEANAEVSSEDDDLLRQFAQVAQSLDPYDLQRDSDEWTLSDLDLMEEMQGGRHEGRRVLDYYSGHGIELALEEYGVADKLRKMGFTELRVNIDPKDRDHQRLTIHGRKGWGAFHLLVDLVIHKLTRTLPAPPPMKVEEPFKLLAVKWLQMQDPTASFSLRHPKLPGQEHPGLGMVQDVMLMLYQACVRLGLDGIAWNPWRYHIGVLGVSYCFFLDPELQGRFDALRATLGGYDLSKSSELLHGGHVSIGGQTVEWDPADYLVPVTERLQAYFVSKPYQDARASAYEAAQQAGIEVDDPGAVAQVAS